MRTLLKLRWFRFSVRTLLIVLTIGCVYLGYVCQTVNNRKALIARLKAEGGRCDSVESINAKYGDQEFKIRTAAVRSWLGDESWIAIELPYKCSDDFAAELGKAFPEAFVVSSVREGSKLRFAARRR